MNATKPEGKRFYVFTATEQEVHELSNDDGGACIACGEEAFGVEPDAREYPCESCGANRVYGAEELVIMGRITFTEPPAYKALEARLRT